jgi:hypothetical protein
MNERPARLLGAFLAFLAVLTASVAGGAVSGGLGCGPFLDVAPDAFCPLILEIFYLGITTGTTPTTFDPSSNVTRVQMAAFLSRTVDGVLKRGSRRAAMNQFWIPQIPAALGDTNLSFQGAEYCAADGLSVWVSGAFGSSVTEVLAGTGGVLGTWTGAQFAKGVLPAMGRVFVAGEGAPGKLYMVNPAGPSGAVTTVATNLGDGAHALAFNGARILSANTEGTVSIITPGTSLPWTVTTVTTGFTSPRGILFVGDTFWVTDNGADRIFRVGSAANILQTVTVGTGPLQPVFDGANIWVPNDFSNSVSVVRASNGAVLATLTGNGLNGVFTAAFDGERVLVTTNANTVSLWKAADLTPIGSVFTGNLTSPFGACSDGVSFWVSLVQANGLGRF